MDAIQYLEKQHREVEKLFAELENASEGSSKQKKDLFQQIAEKLLLHSELEEKIFYPEGRDTDEELTLEAYEEHALVKALIKKTLKLKPTDETFMAKVIVLKEMVQHHVEEEEQQYFPECRKSLGEEKLQAIGDKMQAKEEKKMMPSKKGRGRKAA